MNVETGELRRMEKEDAEELMKAGFVPVPKKHQKEASKKLDGKKSVVVDMKKPSPLTDWANNKRAKIEAIKHKALKAEKKKRKLKVAKASRRRNQV